MSLSDDALSQNAKRLTKRQLSLNLQTKMEQRRNPPMPTPVPVTSFQSAVRSLVDRRWLREGQHRDKVRFTDYSFADPQLADFCGKLLRKAAKMGIPLECLSASYDVAFIAHSRRGRELHKLEWEVIAHLGREINQQYRLGTSWGGPMMPSCWMKGAGPVPF